MFRYSGPLLSFVVIAVCLGINIVRYPTVWEMVDQTAFTAKTAALEQESDEDEYVASEYQTAQTVPELKPDISKEGSPVPPPLGGSPSSSSTRTVFTTNLSKSPPENALSSGFDPIPAYSVPNHRIANLAVPPKVEEEQPVVKLTATNETERAEEVEEGEEDLSGYQPILSQPAYAARYEEQVPPEPEKAPTRESRELSPEEKVEAFRNSPLDLMAAGDSDYELGKTPEWLYRQ